MTNAPPSSHAIVIAARRAVVVTMTAFGLALSGATRSAAAQPAAAPVPSCLAQVTATDSVDTMLHLALGTWRAPRERAPAADLTPAERAALTLALQQLHSAVAVPRELAITLDREPSFEVVGDSTRRPQLVHPAMSGRIAFTLHADGRVSQVSLEASSSSAPLDSALLSTLRREGAAGTLWNLVAPSGRDSVRLRLATTHRASPYQVTAPLVRVRLPLYPGLPAVSIGTAFPRYPAAAQRAGVTGRVSMQFVVDTLGRVEPGSERVLAMSSTEFVHEVRRTLPHLRFRPSIVAGCPMRQLVQQPFVFSLQ